MKAEHHPLEPARLAALRAYDILDTPRESDFDDIVMLASRICGTPISVINLIDETRQWFKAETGLGVRETPLDTSICAHVILEKDFVEISDTLADVRMAVSQTPVCAFMLEHCLSRRVVFRSERYACSIINRVCLTNCSATHFVCSPIR
jgi:GAF domain-containing protein